MDVLSDVLSVVRAGRPRSALVSWQGSWAQEFSPVPGAVGFRVVVRGGCVLVPAGAEPVRLVAGDVVLLPHGRGHVLADSPATPPAARACDPPTEDRPLALADMPEAATVTLCGAYELAPEGGHPLLQDLPEVIHLDTRAGGLSELRTVVDMLGAEAARPRLGTDAAIPALLDMLLLYALRAWFDDARTGSGTGWATALRDPAVAAALHAIHRKPAHPWTVASLAALAGLSRAPFARRFTELVGRPPMRYLTWWRMTTAARLLRESDAPLGSIADAVGYQSEFALAVAFKRQYETPPGRYRRSFALSPETRSRRAVRRGP
ncbi:AraC family transcriptional regulator [Amycolatopsis roodepoortensis]|uniref:AraC-like DNA-binding protein n=1 Tax=Amycolatopsis roodepoortensis TaxID=700274 RepID=A0ABR9L936_9PSEU|nr:AraC family transcriptional regulator [Amycolatopsis roodepoortensis]MBE1577057.1 AraC-like DNA-binding protein [Amycolatopsis roodepoortensis]